MDYFRAATAILHKDYIDNHVMCAVIDIPWVIVFSFSKKDLDDNSELYTSIYNHQILIFSYSYDDYFEVDRYENFIF